MDDRHRPFVTDTSVMLLSPTRAELVRYFAWGYLSRRELTNRLRQSGAQKRRSRSPRHEPTAA
jgi:hypothetical protein